MNARDDILTRIRGRIAKDDDAARRGAVDARLKRHPRNLVPLRGEGDEDHRIGLFTTMMEAVGGTVDVVLGVDDIPHRVAEYLRGQNLPAAIRRGTDPLIAHLPWHRGGTLDVREGRAEESDKASIAHAFAGVAETGTIVLLSGPDNPTTLNFLPEVHIVVLEVKDLFAAYEDAWTKLRTRMGEGLMPRTVNMISGPSRTADIEQTIVRPAHGPKNLHVILVR